MRKIEKTYLHIFRKKILLKTEVGQLSDMIQNFRKSSDRIYDFKIDKTFQGINHSSNYSLDEQLR